MAMTRGTISSVEIEEYQEILDTQGINAVSSIYQLLWDKGYAYGGWAYGVATGSTFTGQAALDFMQKTAGRTLSSTEIDNIRVSMLKGYLGELLKSTAVTGSTNQDLSFKITQAYHKSAFEANNLTIDNWTLEAPMQMVERYFGGIDEVEKLM